MSQKKRVPYRLIRFKNFLTVLVRNRMAFTGLILISMFTFTALAAPVITPYSPQGSVVSAAFDPPAWITFFTGDVGWSQNSAFTGLTARTEGTGVTLAVSNQGTDSISFTASSPGGGKVLIVKQVSFQFKGPPKRFSGDVKITPNGLGTTPATARVYVERSGGGHWQLWPHPEPYITLSSPTEYGPPTSIDSQDADLEQSLGFANTNYNAAQIIFSRIALYTLTLEIDLPQAPVQASFSVRNFGLFLYGNSWGLLGTDSEGHDIFTQLTYGARLSLLVGLLATVIGIGLGLVVGLLAGYLGKVVDEVLMRFTDMMLVIPGLPLLIVLVALIGQSLLNIILILGFLGWMGFARLVRSQVLSLRERPFIEAAKASGAGTGYITLRHIFPNIVSLTYVNLALSVPSAIVGEAALSFLGLGDVSVITWGRMLELSREAGGAANVLWWWIVPPGLAIALISLSFILLGYAMDELFNPRLRRRR